MLVIWHTIFIAEVVQVRLRQEITNSKCGRRGAHIVPLAQMMQVRMRHSEVATLSALWGCDQIHVITCSTKQQQAMTEVVHLMCRCIDRTSRQHVCRQRRIASAPCMSCSVDQRHLYLWLEGALRDGAPHCDPALPDVAVLTKQLQPPPAGQAARASRTPVSAHVSAKLSSR